MWYNPNEKMLTLQIHFNLQAHFRLFNLIILEKVNFPPHILFSCFYVPENRIKMLKKFSFWLNYCNLAKKLIVKKIDPKIVNISHLVHV